MTCFFLKLHISVSTSGQNLIFYLPRNRVFIFSLLGLFIVQKCREDIFFLILLVKSQYLVYKSHCTIFNGSKNGS